MFRYYPGNFEIAKIETCKNFFGYNLQQKSLELQENDLHNLKSFDV